MKMTIKEALLKQKERAIRREEKLKMRLEQEKLKGRVKRKEKSLKKLKDWHKAVLERENYMCQVCRRDFNSPPYFQGDVNQYLCGHHVKTQGSHPELRYNVDNGICVCLICHNRIHNGEIKLPN